MRMERKVFAGGQTSEMQRPKPQLYQKYKVVNYCDNFEDGTEDVNHGKNNSNHSARHSLDTK